MPLFLKTQALEWKVELLIKNAYKKDMCISV